MATDGRIRGYRYTTCRLLGHAWEIVPSDWTPTYGVPMTCRCERCSIERRDSVNRNTGAVESRHYTYPLGYSIPREDGYEALARNDFRVAWLEGVVAESRKRRQGSTTTRQTRGK